MADVAALTDNQIQQKLEAQGEDLAQREQVRAYTGPHSPGCPDVGEADPTLRVCAGTCQEPQLADEEAPF